MEPDEIEAIIYGAIMEVSPGAMENMGVSGALQREVHFIDVGINSIDYAEIVHIVMEKLKVELPLDIFARTNSIQGAAKIFYNLNRARH